MKGLFGRTISILEQAIYWRTKRNSLIASNIANIETPGYKAKDIPFEKIMNRYLKQPNKGSPLTRTEPGHMAPDGSLRIKRNTYSRAKCHGKGVSMGPSSNGSELVTTDPRHFSTGNPEDSMANIMLSNERGIPNSVDLDQEMAKLAENNLQYQAAVQALIKEMELLKTAIIEGGK